MTAPVSTRQARHYRVQPSVKVGVAMIVAYMLVFNGLQLVAGIDYADYFASAGNAWKSAVIPLAAGAVLLVAFVVWSGWDLVWKDPGRLPMGWVLKAAPLVFAVVLLARWLGVDWPAVPSDLYLPIILTGVLVGFCEETLFRGIVLRSLRTGGRSEAMAVLFSSLLFGVFHLANALFGQSAGALVAQVLLATCAGTTLYLFRRWSGLLMVGMVAHGAWDASLFFIDGRSAENLVSAIATVPGISLVPLLGLLSLIVIVRRDRQLVVDPDGVQDRAVAAAV